MYLNKAAMADGLHVGICLILHMIMKAANEHVAAAWAVLVAEHQQCALCKPESQSDFATMC